jgi:hypothetical protein
LDNTTGQPRAPAENTSGFSALQNDAYLGPESYQTSQQPTGSRHQAESERPSDAHGATKPDGSISTENAANSAEPLAGKLTDFVQGLAKLTFEGADESNKGDIYYEILLPIFKHEAQDLGERIVEAYKQRVPNIEEVLKQNYLDRDFMHDLLAKNPELTARYDKMLQSVDRLQPRDEGYENLANPRLSLVQQTIDQWTNEAGLPPLQVSLSDDANERGHYKRGSGKIGVYTPQFLKSGRIAKELVDTLAHETVHFEQEVLITRMLADQENITGTTCSAEQRQRIKDSFKNLLDAEPRDEFIDSVLKARNGTTLSSAQRERVRWLLQSSATEDPGVKAYIRAFQSALEANKPEVVRLLADPRNIEKVFGDLADEAAPAVANYDSPDIGLRTQAKAKLAQLIEQRLGQFDDHYHDAFEQEAWRTGRQAQLLTCQSEANTDGRATTPAWQRQFSIAQQLTDDKAIAKLASELATEVSWENLTAMSNQQKGDALTAAVKSVLTRELGAIDKDAHFAQNLEITACDKEPTTTLTGDHLKIEIPDALLSGGCDPAHVVGLVCSALQAKALAELDGISKPVRSLRSFMDKSIEVESRHAAAEALQGPIVSDISPEQISTYLSYLNANSTAGGAEAMNTVMAEATSALVNGLDWCSGAKGRSLQLALDRTSIAGSASLTEGSRLVARDRNGAELTIIGSQPDPDNPGTRLLITDSGARVNPADLSFVIQLPKNASMQDAARETFIRLSELRARIAPPEGKTDTAAGRPLRLSQLDDMLRSIQNDTLAQSDTPPISAQLAAPEGSPTSMRDIGRRGEGEPNIIIDENGITLNGTHLSDSQLAERTIQAKKEELERLKGSNENAKINEVKEQLAQLEALKNKLDARDPAALRELATSLKQAFPDEHEARNRGAAETESPRDPGTIGDAVTGPAGKVTAYLLIASMLAKMILQNRSRENALRHVPIE